jgi:hypothetical protein
MDAMAALIVRALGIPRRDARRHPPKSLRYLGGPALRREPRGIGISFLLIVSLIEAALKEPTKNTSCQ